jgi:monoamine oxidase
MEKADVLIIGAGATGLMAARTLAKAGKQVIVLEARERCGGRIHTLHHEFFFKQAELGAEFIHGDLPVTLGLLNEAGITYQPSDGEMWRYEHGQFKTGGDATPGWDLLLERLGELKQDCSINDFLQREFPGDEHADLRKAVIRFASGYDTANPDDASAFALRDEWQHEDDGTQHRLEKGYGTMINYLADECKAAGGTIHLNSVVTAIYHGQGQVQAITTDGLIYYARQLIIALPLGVLKADKDEPGAITFHPPIPEQKEAVQAMGFGAIIKILLEFNEPFWRDKRIEEMIGESTDQMGFILSDEEIPTWWTQSPQNSPVLTGWLGGPPAAKKKDATEEELLQLSLRSLGNIFKLEPKVLKDKLVAFNCVNWTADPYTRGSYAYDTVASPASRKLLNKPVDNSLFFAGEYLYEGTAMGTVEAALTSGAEAAEKLIQIAKD